MADVDLSEFEKLSERDQRRPCKLAAARAKLDEAERALLDEALAADKRRITTGAIAKWFELRGERLSLPAISTHRNGRCVCNG